MGNTSLHVQISSFRSRRLVWVMLVILAWSWMPALSLAQQPTATISALNGTVLVNGQEKGKGTILSAGDVLETQAGASVVLELSDGSSLELGENTKLDIAELSQTATGARVSRVKLLWGRIRAKLSAGHQQAGSTFDIETPNALVGVKFSEPDIEVSYDPAKQETVGIAHTVELIAINLLTNEKITVPVGSTVVIVGLLMKLMVGTTAAVIVAETGTAAVGTTTTGTTPTAGTTAAGVSKGTLIAIGVGAAAAAGGVAAVTAISGDSDKGDADGDIDWNNPFTGTFAREISGSSDPDYTPCVPPVSTYRLLDAITLTQSETVLTGTYSATLTFGNCCTATSTVPLTGTVVDATTAINISGPLPEFYCEGSNCSCEDEFGRSGPIILTLVENGRILRWDDVGDIADFYRQ